MYFFLLAPIMILSNYLSGFRSFLRSLVGSTTYEVSETFLLIPINYNFSLLSRILVSLKLIPMKNDPRQMLLTAYKLTLPTTFERMSSLLTFLIASRGP